MIKKIVLGMALLMSMASCTGDYTDWASPQSNPQEDAVKFGNGSISPVDVIDFANIADDQTEVKVCDITAPTVTHDGYEPTYGLLLGSANEIIVISEEGKMSLSALKDYVVSNYGKAPVERSIDAIVFMWESNGKSTVRVNTSDVFQIKVKLVAPDISNNYYILGGTLDWAASAASKEQKFNHSATNVYDDPVFTITIPAAEGADTWFAIASEEACDAIANDNDWSKVLGSKLGNGKNGINETEVMDTRANLGNDGSFCVPASYGAKYIKVTINMMDGTYSIKPLNFGAYFYEIGGESGWSASHALYGANYDGKYQGFYYLNGEFKFKPNADNWSGDYEYNGEGKIADIDGGSNCPDPGAGFYQIDVDLVEGTYALTQVNSITCVGNHNSWTVDDANCHMTYNVEAGCWELTTALKDGFKFAMNDAWSISWGGADDNPANYGDLSLSNGKDLNVPDGEGTYKIQLYLSYEGANKVVLTKQ